MNATTQERAESSPVEAPIAGFSSTEADVYQSVSRSAVASVVLGGLGLLSFLFAPMLLLTVCGIAFSLVAFYGFRKFPDELLGKPVAIAGFAICLITIVAAPAYHTAIYLTEVPEGYERVDFSVLKSKLNEADQPPQEALKLDGQQVFIKGYIHPSSMDSSMSKRFVLVPDLGTCCFGGQPPLTHMIEVSLKGEQYAYKTYRKQRLAGTLYVNPQIKPIDGLTGVYYQLRADILK